MSYATFSEGLGYEGKVTLTLKSNGRVIKSHTYKNNGTVELFKFLGNCLLGRFTEATKLLPTKILLLYNDSKDPITKNARSVTPRSNFIGYAQTPSIVDDAKTERVKVTYNFEVPYQLISDNFNQIALYGDKKTRSDYADFSAYYYLTENGKFATQEISNWSPTTVLLVEWELSISNKNVILGNPGEEV